MSVYVGLRIFYPNYSANVALYRLCYLYTVTFSDVYLSLAMLFYISFMSVLCYACRLYLEATL